jgi:glycosyltransferase involved in cell wall biosynthesis
MTTSAHEAANKRDVDRIGHGREAPAISSVALLASRLSVLGEDPCGGSEVVLWEDATILQKAGIPVRVYGRAARNGAPVNVIPLRGGNAQIHSLQYGGRLLRREREALIIAYNEPALAGWAPDRTIVRYDWNTPLPRYWSWPLWLPRFQRARYLFPSDSERQLFLGQHKRIPPSSTFVVPNAVDLDLFRPLDGAVASRAGRGLRVGYAGQWVPRKGIDDLLEAWRVVKSSFPSAELHMAGGADLWKNSSETAGAKASAEQIREMREQGLLRCVGSLPRNRMPEFWNSVDAAVVPSLYEPFGLVALEALACGVPVVCTTAGGLKEVVVHGESGLLVPPGDSDALAHALLAVLTNDSLRLRLAKGARKQAQHFSLTSRSRELLRVFEMAARRARTSA